MMLRLRLMTRCANFRLGFKTKVASRNHYFLYTPFPTIPSFCRWLILRIFMANSFTAAEHSAFLLQIVKVGLFLAMSRRSETDFKAQYVNGGYGMSNIETHLKHFLWEVSSFTILVRRHRHCVLLLSFSPLHRSLTTCIRFSWKCAPSIGHHDSLLNNFKIELIWCQKWGLVKFLFLCSRYSAFFDTPLVLYCMSFVSSHHFFVAH